MQTPYNMGMLSCPRKLITCMSVIAMFIRQPLSAEPAAPMRSTAEIGTGVAATLSPAEGASAEGTPEVSKRKYVVGAVPGANILAQVSTGVQVKLFKDQLKKTPISDRKSTPEVPEWVAIAQVSFIGTWHL